MLNSQQAIMTSKEKYLKLERSDLDQPFPSAALMTCDTGRTVTGVSPWCSATAPGPPGRPPGGWSLPSGGLALSLPQRHVGCVLRHEQSREATATEMRVRDSVGFILSGKQSGFNSFINQQLLLLNGKKRL